MIDILFVLCYNDLTLLKGSNILNLIETERLILEPLGTKYLNTVHEYASDIENTKYMMYLPNETVKETIDFLQSVDREWLSDAPSFYEYAVIYDGHHIGAVSLTIEDELSGELGWIINKKYQKRGFAYEAAQALVGHSVKELGIKHFIAHCDAENIASYKTMEKLGMIRTGEYGGRKNKSSDEERTEYRYELCV